MTNTLDMPEMFPISKMLDNLLLWYIFTVDMVVHTSPVHQLTLALEMEQLW